jgi:hypothetical protein
MAPSVVSTIVESAENTEAKNSIKIIIAARQPLEYRGKLDEFNSFDVTPVIGREFPNAKLVDWLRAPNSDELLRDLAVTSTQTSSLPGKLSNFLN